jgi:hypothetical protein
MKGLWPAVCAEAVKAVGGMKAGTTFDVAGGADEKSWRFKAGPVPATRAAAAELHDFLSERAAGGYTSLTEPAEQVLASGPDVLWLVSDGDLPNHKAFLDRVARANPGRRTRINVVMPVAEEPDETRDEMIAFLKKVAADNGGKFAIRRLPEGAGGGKEVPRGRSIFHD